ncbi:MAG: DNA topoisomerase IB [Fimbriimonadaceae bacterium]|nr:DNA topoisomerase IB [Chitinophagales bacterium]
MTNFNIGFTREKRNEEIIYLDLKGKIIEDAKILDRLKKLVIPPAWQNVWICKNKNGHIQATGLDEKGRKQYIYHKLWNEVRNETKFSKMLLFGTHLPKIRKQIHKDLKRKMLCKEKVVALAVQIIDKIYIRVGGTVYEQLYGSYGLTTLKDKHVRISGSIAIFKFRGKKGVQREIKLKNSGLAKLLKEVQDIPGQSLFQYYDLKGKRKTIYSNDINAYLKTYTQQCFTAKDFRTWAGTVMAIEFLSAKQLYKTKNECNKNIIGMLDYVASELGNTRTVCKNYYVYPQIIKEYENGNLYKYFKADMLKKTPSKHDTAFHTSHEKMLIKILKELSNDIRLHIAA